MRVYKTIETSLCCKAMLLEVERDAAKICGQGGIKWDADTARHGVFTNDLNSSKGYKLLLMTYTLLALGVFSGEGCELS